MEISVALSSTVSKSNWNFGNVGFCGGKKTGVSGEKPSEEGRKPTTSVFCLFVDPTRQQETKA